jgi:type VI secretion system protein ImpE
MSASDLYKAGRLQEALDAQVQEVKKSPADHGKRLFLFELLCFAGELDRAARQIQAVKYDEVETDAAVQTYAKLLDSERARRTALRDGTKPEFLIDPPPSVNDRLEAISRLREKRPAEAAALLAKANSAVTVKGRLNNNSVEALRDCDDVFGPVLEVMAQGKYYWLPLEQIDTMVMKAPKFPRDLLWIPARVEIRDGPSGDVFLPALYPFSHEHADDQVKLGRRTDWKTEQDGPAVGVGLRMFLAGDDAISVLEWRELQVTAE